MPTPDFGDGVVTPDFGEDTKWVHEVAASFGPGRVLEVWGAEWHRFPMCSLTGPMTEAIRVGEELRRSYPKEPYPFPARGIERRKDERGYNYIVRWPGKLRFEGETGEKETVWFNVNKETYAGEAEEACWEYFHRRFRSVSRARVCGANLLAILMVLVPLKGSTVITLGSMARTGIMSSGW